MRPITILQLIVVYAFIMAPVCVKAQQSDSITSPVWDTLAGELPDLVKNNGRPYYIAADIIVPPGKTVTIEPGTVLLFHTFTGLQIHGVLLARGSENSPILFSSENDGRHGGLAGLEPAPYDWNGITIDEDALGTSFYYCTIAYSLFGINTLCGQIHLRRCSFPQNAKSEYTVQGYRQIVGDSPYSWGDHQKAVSQATTIASPPDITTSTTSVRKGNVGLRIVGIGLLTAGSAIGVWKTIDYLASRKRFDELNASGNRENLQNPSIVEDWNTAQTTVNRDSALMVGGFALAVLGAIGIGFSFAW
jgi:hypothetical protein